MKQESYYAYIKRRYKEMSDEYKHQGDLFRFGYTQCAECGDLLHQEEAQVHVYYNGHMQQQEHFCPDRLKPEESCQQKWYIKHLNRAGL